MGTCLYCSPFFFQYENQRAPKCGKFPKELGGSVFVATCPLYDLCAKRVTRELWAPCESPDRSDLLYIHGLDDDEYIEALELLELGFDQSGQVANQGLRFWLNHYEAVLNDLS